MKKYEILIDCIRFNRWATELNVSSQYTPTEFNGVRTTNTKIVKPKRTILSRIKNLFNGKY